MKITSKDKKEFQPITIEITFEDLEEVASLAKFLNLNASDIDKFYKEMDDRYLDEYPTINLYDLWSFLDGIMENYR